MDVLHLEVTSVTLSAVSLFVYGWATYADNHYDAHLAKRSVLFFGAVSLALAFPLGAFGWRDVFLPIGLAILVMAIEKRDEMDMLVILACAAAVPYALWVFYYPMTSAEYGLGYGLAVLDPAILVVILRMHRPKKDPAPKAGASTLAF